ncbi:dihydroorotate dehydrogenase [Anaerococcus vaginalis]|uniref:Dihydroorotate dehydrogenase n=2 Tax=Anaerococcus vaginalis TaxID=33037 RepID=C7HU77_9FIRM|nr:dihydroorotate dehydrogenase [Anaerococcus vaginalis]EEU12645.1 dihydroorotate oxidase [Anaerococcus vaginalis ATCC 51170]QQB61200.1 dihydroorotate dehydrogenase [Anaerococcus vaginalis]
MSLKVNICGIEFNNPVIAASGTFGFGKEFAEYIDINKLGGISSKGLTLHKNLGNKGIRIYETAAGIMNSIGLQNPGIEYFIKEELPFLETKDAVTIANLGGHSVEDYVKGAQMLDKTSVPIIELNISCPNVKEGGMAFGTNPKKACEVIEKVRKATKKVLMVKLSPNVGDIKEFVKIAENSGADCISLVNTFNALAIDVDNKKAVFENKTAGLSGPCIKPIALRMVYEASNATNLPIIGMGGISNYRDCLEFIMAGASAVQVGTSNFVDFNTMINIVDDLEKYMQKENLNSLEEIRKII